MDVNYAGPALNPWHNVSSPAGPSRILAWHINETKSLAITDWFGIAMVLVFLTRLLRALKSFRGFTLHYNAFCFEHSAFHIFVTFNMTHFSNRVNLLGCWLPGRDSNPWTYSHVGINSSAKEPDQRPFQVECSPSVFKDSDEVTGWRNDIRIPGWRQKRYRSLHGVIL